MDWQRLDPKSAKSVIQQVQSSTDPGLISATSSQVDRAHLPFYRGCALFKVTNYASLPSFTFFFLGDGQFFHYLDGSQNALSAMHNQGFLRLDPENILDYLTFHYRYVRREEGDIYIIHDADHMPFIDVLDEASQLAIRRAFRPAEISQNPENGDFDVLCCIYDSGIMNFGHFSITKDGVITLIEETMIANNFGPDTVSGTKEAASTA